MYVAILRLAVRVAQTERGARQAATNRLLRRRLAVRGLRIHATGCNHDHDRQRHAYSPFLRLYIDALHVLSPSLEFLVGFFASDTCTDLNATDGGRSPSSGRSSADSGAERRTGAFSSV